MYGLDYKVLYSHNNLNQSPYDNRDYKFGDLLCTGDTEVPENYETPDLGWSYDQKQSSMCAPSAYCYLRCLQESENTQSQLTEKLCPSFNYANREIGHDHEGMHLRVLCSKGREGSILFDRMKYPNTYEGAKAELLENEAIFKAEAKPFRITKYYTCNSRLEVQKAIMMTKGVLLGVQVYDCFYKPDKDGIITYVEGQKSNGGHAVVIDGWKMINGKLYWRIKNSWGDRWGNLGTGHAYLPEEYPWMDKVYVIIDEVLEIKFDEYKDKFQKEQFKKVSFWDFIIQLFRQLFNK